MLAYLCVVLNPADDLRLLRIVNTPTRGIGQTTLDTASELAARTGQPVFEVFKASETYEELRKSAPRLHQFAAMLEELRALSSAMPLDAFYDALLDRTGYVRALEAKVTDENLSRIENVRELKSNIVNFLSETQGGTLFDFLNEIALYTDIDQYDRGSDSVVMMTMHSAKGLEFPNVFIVGAEEGIFPRRPDHRRARGDGGGAPALLCRDDAGQKEAHLYGGPAAHDLRPDDGRQAVAICRRGFRRQYRASGTRFSVHRLGIRRRQGGAVHRRGRPGIPFPRCRPYGTQEKRVQAGYAARTPRRLLPIPTKKAIWSATRPSGAG